MMSYKDPEKQRVCIKKYKQDNKKLLAKKRRQYKRDNSDYFRKDEKQYIDAHPWIRHYKNARQRCYNHNAHNFKSYGAKGIEVLASRQDFKYLWHRDQAYLLKQPSIDRIDSKKSYTRVNCRFIELIDNIRRK